MTERHQRWLVLAVCGLIVLVAATGGVQRAGASRDAADTTVQAIARAVESGQLVEKDLVLGESSASRTTSEIMAPVVIERQGFEGADFPPAGWQVVDLAARSDRVDDRYKWNRETCEVEPLVGGQAASWMAGDGTEGTKLPCVSPLPANAKVNTWLSYTFDLSQYPLGLLFSSKLFLDQPLNERGALTNLQVGVVNLETSQGVIYNISSPRPLSWLPLELPEDDLAQFGGLPQVAVVFMYQDNPSPGGHVGAVVDNVVIQGRPVEIPTETPTPTVTNTPLWTATPTATATPVLLHIQLPFTWRDITVDQIPRPTPMPIVGAEVVFGTAVDAQTGRVTGQGTKFPAGVPLLCAKMRWYGQPIGTDFRWQWYRNDSPADLPGINGSITIDKAEGFDYRCVENLPNGRYEVRVYIGGASEATTAGAATVGD